MRRRSGVPRMTCGHCSSTRLVSPGAESVTRSRWSRWARSRSGTCWWWVPAKWCRWTGGSKARWRCSTSRSSPVNRCRSNARSASRCAAAWSTPQPRSRSAPRPPPSTAPTPGLCGWPSRPAPKAPRLFGWPTATPHGFCRWRWWWRAWRGWPVGRRCGRWRCWSWRRRVRCCSPRRWRSCPVCPGPLATVW